MKVNSETLGQQSKLRMSEKYCKSDAAKRGEKQSFTGSTADAKGPAPNEAWVTMSKMKFQIYVRRVVQFCLLASSGLEDQLAPLRQANIQTMLAKYKRLVDGALWASCLLPVDFLEVACRAELLPTCLSTDAEKDFQDIQNTIKETDPMLLRSLEEPVDYAKMRELPITIFGTRSSGSYVNKEGSGLAPGAVLGKHVNYKNLEVQCPHEDTMAALEALVKTWLTTPHGRGNKITPRSVHVFLVYARVLEYERTTGTTHTSDC